MKVGSPRPKPPPPKAEPVKAPVRSDAKPAPSKEKAATPAAKPAAPSTPPDTKTIEARQEQQTQRAEHFKQTGERPKLVTAPHTGALAARLQAQLDTPSTPAPTHQEASETVVPDMAAVAIGPQGGGGEGEEQEYLRTTSGLNLRSVPTTEGNDPIVEIPNGAIIEVTPDSDGNVRDGDFVHVSWDNEGTSQTGWVHEGYTEPQSAADVQAQGEAREGYIHQFDAETQVSYTTADGVEVDGDGRNGNCGPTSVVMALRAQGLSLPDIPGIEHNGTDGADIQAARFHMYNDLEGNEFRDGVVLQDPDNPDAGFEYAPMNGTGNENSQFTGFPGVANAVDAAGGEAVGIPATSEGVAEAINDGASVVISGSFLEPNEAPVMAAEGEPRNELGQLIDGEGNVVMARPAKTDTWARGGGATEHLVAVTGMTEEGNFIVSDPAHPSRGPIIATPAELDAFMRGNPGAMAISAPEPTTPPAHTPQ